jgi:hypothetical protein
MPPRGGASGAQRMAMQRRQIYAGYEGPPNPGERDRIVHFLDSYRASEGFVAEYLGGWIAVTTDPALQGGLRVLREREAAHARLLAARLRELGGEARAIVPAERSAATLQRYGSAEVSDRDKLEGIAELFADPAHFLQPLADLIETIESDRHTRELLATILDDEWASIRWLLAMHRRAA